MKYEVPESAGPTSGGTGFNGVFLDTTILRFAKDLRGIHQVVFRFVEILATDPRFAGTRFIAAENTFEPYLKPLGVGRESVIEMPATPLIGRFERFHGISSTRRYRKILPAGSRLIIHPELRTMARVRVPQAVCFHDFIELEPPTQGQRKWDRRLYYSYKCRRAATAAFKMANSQHTLRRALKLFPEMDPDSIQVVHLGVRRGLEPVHSNRSRALDPPVCLYVGSYEARKNIPLLLSRFREVAGDTGAVLHLAGHAGPGTREFLLRLAAGAGVSDRIRWHGLVTDSELRGLYASAHFLLFPSLNEGFGLPLAEAMAHGLVVCAFRNSSIPEVVAQAGVLAEDGDLGAWGRAITGMARNPDSYAAFSERARQRAEYFSEASARSRLSDWLDRIFSAAGVPNPEGVHDA